MLDDMEDKRRVQDPGVSKNAFFNGYENYGKKSGTKIQLLKKAFLMITLMVLLGGSIFSNIGPHNVEADETTNAQDPAHWKKLIAFLKETNPTWTNYSYDQLKQWYDAQIPGELRFEEFPRLYPFCVTKNQTNDTSRTPQTSHIYRFLEIFTEIERIDEKFYNFNQTKHSTVNNTDWIKKIRLTRITTPEMDMVNLRQWLHIEVTTAQPSKGLYMQSIVGPMGLPFGEFYLDFPCKDDLENTRDMDKIGELSYCSYRPRATIQHPSVYVGYDPNPRTEFHAHFFWTDITCMETPYLQFLFLVVKDFDYNDTTKGGAKIWEHYAPQLSPIYLNTDFDSKSGAPFPYYPEWRDNMYCFLNEMNFKQTYEKAFPGEPSEPNDVNPYYNKFPSEKNGADPLYEKIKWEESKEAYRIQANEQYDACIVGKLKLKDSNLKNEDRLECPPGPFQCDTAYAQQVNPDDVKNERVKLVQEEVKISKCIPCGAPPCRELGFPEYKCDNLEDKIYIDVNESVELNEVESIIRGTNHGIQAMLAFLVLVPISNFMARFYKEVCSHFLFDNGPWIFIHIGTHIASLMFMWVSLGPVMPQLTDSSQKRACRGQHPTDNVAYAKCRVRTSAENPHVPLALIAFIFQHILVGTGFWRSANERLRNIQVAVHSHLGYGCWLFGAISVIVVGSQKSCPDILIMSILSFVTPFVFSAIAVSLDCILDRRIGIIPMRKQYPVLEQIKLEGRGPFTLQKWILFGVFSGFMVFFWIMQVGSSFTILANSKNLFSNKKKKRGFGSLFAEKCGDILSEVQQNREKTKRVGRSGLF